MSETLSERLLHEHGVDALSADEIEFLSCLEHRRWNAYMRGEGYTYSSVRDDIAKTHYDLVSYFDLPLEERIKDIF